MRESEIASMSLHTPGGGVLVKCGKVLHSEGDQVRETACLRVVSGLIGLRTTDGLGREVFVATVREGQYFGIEVLKKEQRWRHSAVALLKDTLVHRIPLSFSAKEALIEDEIQRLRELEEIFIARNIAARVAIMQARIPGIDQVTTGVMAMLVGACREMVGNVNRQLRNRLH